jgi:signal transduction histidine kinase
VSVRRARAIINLMPATGVARPAPWYRTFYWRIGLSFLVFVVLVVVGQNVMFGYLMARSRFAGRSPNNLAAIVAADLQSTLAQTPGTDLQQHLDREYGSVPPIYVIMKDGRRAANQSRRLNNNLRRNVEALLAGTDFKRGGEPPPGGPPAVMAPIQVTNELRGIVVLPAPPPRGRFAGAVGRIFSVPGTVLLVLATALAAIVIFEPARRRLQALERATQTLGAGDLTARAPEHGGDEIARVAAAFNRMAADLAVRDQALKTSDRLRRQMLADVSHELKTPLTAMRGYVETLHLADATLDPATRERYFATIERETLRLDRIVRDLVDLARVENGVGAFDARVFSVGRVFEHVADRHEQEAESRSIALKHSVADAADQAVGDPDRIEQVIENLVANALRHTPDGGSIAMDATAGNGAVVLSVIDSGAGIPAEHIPHVFDRFYKVDAARAASGSGGSGLGLSITKAIVERHGGTIEVVSRPGRTAFVVRLPQDDPVGQAVT